MRSISTLAAAEITAITQAAARTEVAAEEADGEGDPESIAETILAIKSAIGKGGAPLPQFREACEWLGVDPTTLELVDDLGKGSRNHLKPWQAPSK